MCGRFTLHSTTCVALCPCAQSIRTVDRSPVDLKDGASLSLSAAPLEKEDRFKLPSLFHEIVRLILPRNPLPLALLLSSLAFCFSCFFFRFLLCCLLSSDPDDMDDSDFNAKRILFFGFPSIGECDEESPYPAALLPRPLARLRLPSECG